MSILYYFKLRDFIIIINQFYFIYMVKSIKISSKNYIYIYITK